MPINFSDIDPASGGDDDDDDDDNDDDAITGMCLCTTPKLLACLGLSLCGVCGVRSSVRLRQRRVAVRQA
jgi:hypothetical protein